MGILGGILGDLIKPAKDLVSEVIVDVDKKRELEYNLQVKEAEALAKLEQMIHEEVMAQSEINKIEASHKSIFVAGWRPFIGWVCGVSLAWTAIGAPIVGAITGIHNLPVVDQAFFTPILMAMLGMGSLRTIEAIKGVKSNTLKQTAKVKPLQKIIQGLPEWVK
jgi:hypothetical protein